MSTSSGDLLEQARTLPAIERAALVDALLATLDRPDPDIDSLWAAEAADRLAAHEAGRVGVIPADEVFAEFSDS
jgi:putative addiction module component (TIGR02574 family)